MFLDVVERRNPALVAAAVSLHQQGALPANTYAYDLDAIGANAAGIAAEARRLGLTPYAMLKQLGRNPDVTRTVRDAGIGASVAVDMACARATFRAGMPLGHVGHLVQVPRGEADEAAAMTPREWTVFSEHKAREAAAAAARLGLEQRLVARVHAGGDEFYAGHEGGFAAEDVLEVADRLDALDGARFAGLTTFPALLFDRERNAVRRTHNLATLERAVARLQGAGRADVVVNGPGTTSTRTLAALAEVGVTHVEPGHALTGSTPWHATTTGDDDLPEVPAAVYVSEVSHHHGGRAYFFGGGLYVDPVFPTYQVQGLVGSDPDGLARLDATLPPREAIDYYGQLDQARGTAASGDTVVLGFRSQAFVTRAFTAGITGVASGNPQLAGVWTAEGTPVLGGFVGRRP
ncbi:putative amino acid racemase [Sediminihabitans luteus]|uniref:Putative amino acid racemase n=1 Tax=Sediminihabitans luteus TaxID=1138585 RepID=A0A2M9CEZ9_9CELL|nr:alanine racemase [Sediminihabitans luteus]PJJ70432.1 putative amino acid racemase [Sediminihabitans luteus]GII97905.1 amino-acid racemase [Sediminihabitans luteus]